MVRFARGSFRSLNRVVVVHRTRDLSSYKDRDEIRASADVLELGEMYAKKNELVELLCLLKTDTMTLSKLDGLENVSFKNMSEKCQKYARLIRSPLLQNGGRPLCAADRSPPRPRRPHPLQRHDAPAPLRALISDGRRVRFDSRNLLRIWSIMYLIFPAAGRH